VGSFTVNTSSSTTLGNYPRGFDQVRPYITSTALINGGESESREQKKKKQIE